MINMQLVGADINLPSMVRMPKQVRDYLSRQGKRHGRAGGLKRAARLTPERRSEIARAAANARWAKRDQP